MIADGTPIFGLTGWEGTFAALDTSAAICIVLLLFVAIAEEKKIRHAKKMHLAAQNA
jgi:OPA family hexose phosphate transport protein UhpT-like MFS transporter